MAINESAPTSAIQIRSLVTFFRLSLHRLHFLGQKLQIKSGCLQTYCPTIQHQIRMSLAYSLRYIIEDVSEDDDHSGDLSKRLKYPAKPFQLLMICHDDDSAMKKKMFQIGDQVIGLFPNTTCLYNGTVVAVPSKKKKIFEYQLQFENDEIDGQIPWRIVPARFVLERPQASNSSIGAR